MVIELSLADVPLGIIKVDLGAALTIGAISKIAFAAPRI